MFKFYVKQCDTCMEKSFANQRSALVTECICGGKIKLTGETLEGSDGITWTLRAAPKEVKVSNPKIPLIYDFSLAYPDLWIHIDSKGERCAEFDHDRRAAIMYTLPTQNWKWMTLSHKEYCTGNLAMSHVGDGSGTFVDAMSRIALWLVYGDVKNNRR